MTAPMEDPLLKMRQYLESVGLLDEKKTQEYEARAKEDRGGGGGRREHRAPRW